MNTDNEEWRAIPGFEGRYEVSDHGRVRSLRMINAKVNKERDEPKILAGSRDKDGRRRVCLARGHGAILGRPVGVLVLLAFVGPRPAGHDCRHADGVAGNDRIENLSWSTHAENMADMRAHGTYNAPPVRRGAANNKTVLTEGDVRLIRAEPNYRGVNARLAERFGILPASVGNIRAARTWKHLA